MLDFSDLSQYKQCRVLGFNSAKFDMNLFINYLAKFAHVKNDNGSSTSFKSVTVIADFVSNHSSQTSVMIESKLSSRRTKAWTHSVRTY